MQRHPVLVLIQWPRIRLAFLAAFLVVASVAGGTAALVAGREPLRHLAGRTVVIDAGHGGIDGGAVAGTLKEKDANLAFALELEGILRRALCRVYLTREADVSLEAAGPPLRSRHARDLAARTTMASAMQAEAVISLHMDISRDPARRGSSAYYRKGSPLGKLLGSLVLEELAGVTGSPSRGLLTKTLYLTRKAPDPTVLLEVGFLSNPRDAELATDTARRRRVALAIANALDRYFASPTVPSVPRHTAPRGSLYME